jgi:hypothetical protein
MLRLDKIERDIVAYAHSIRDKDSKLALLHKRLKAQEIEHHTEMDKLRRESFELTYSFNAIKKSLR